MIVRSSSMLKVCALALFVPGLVALPGSSGLKSANVIDIGNALTPEFCPLCLKVFSTVESSVGVFPHEESILLIKILGLSLQTTPSECLKAYDGDVLLLHRDSQLLLVSGEGPFSKKWLGEFGSSTSSSISRSAS